MQLTAEIYRKPLDMLGASMIWKSRDFMKWLVCQTNVTTFQQQKYQTSRGILPVRALLSPLFDVLQPIHPCAIGERSESCIGYVSCSSTRSSSAHSGVPCLRKLMKTRRDLSGPDITSAPCHVCRPSWRRSPSLKSWREISWKKIVARQSPTTTHHFSAFFPLSSASSSRVCAAFAEPRS